MKRTCIRLPAFIGALLFLGGCVTTSNVPTDIADDIPEDARSIRLYSNQNPAEYYRIIYQSFVRSGFSIAQENGEMGTFSTDFKEIGQGTTLRINVFVEETTSGSVATMRGQWGLTATMAAGFSAALGASTAGATEEEANWGSSGRPRSAFGAMAVLAADIPHTRLEYVER
jgi:hypothetical protein